ncbi:MAG: hypothetical protein EZS28_011632 [Streblomastix strix]|nr:MAG: hypothetical protein EZS28_011632 [Streblomastix strix]
MGSSTEHPVPAAHLAISKQRGDARVSDGDGLQQSPQGDDLFRLFIKYGSKALCELLEDVIEIRNSLLSSGLLHIVNHTLSIEIQGQSEIE